MKKLKTTMILLSLLVVSTLGLFYYRVYHAGEIKDTVSFEIVSGDESYAENMELVGRGYVGDQPTGDIRIKQDNSVINRPSAPRSLYVISDPEYLALVKEYPHYYRGKENSNKYYQSDQWIVNSSEFFDRFGDNTETSVTMTISSLQKNTEEIIESDVTVEADGQISNTSLKDAKFEGDLVYLFYDVTIDGVATSYIVLYDLSTGQQISSTVAPNIKSSNGVFIQKSMHFLSSNQVIITNSWKKPASSEESDEENIDPIFVFQPDQFVFQIVNLQTGNVETLEGAEAIRDNAEVIVIDNGVIHGFTYTDGVIQDISYDIASREVLPVVDYPVTQELFTSLGEAIKKVDEDGNLYLAEVVVGSDKKAGVVVLDLENQEVLMKGMVTHEGKQLDSIIFENFE